MINFEDILKAAVTPTSVTNYYLNSVYILTFDPCNENPVTNVKIQYCSY